MAHTPTSPAPTAAGKPAEACKPAIEHHNGKLSWAVVILAILVFTITMIVESNSSAKAGSPVKGGAGLPAGRQISFSTEPPIYFGPSKCVEVDLKVDEWSPRIVTPERCKDVYLVINPPVGYRIRFSDGTEITAGPKGLGEIPPRRMDFRLLGVQPGQKAVVRVAY